MRFATWLRRQTKRRDPVGDLARDFIHDPEAPHAFRAFRAYVRDIGCEGAIDAVARAIREWRQDQRGC